VVLEENIEDSVRNAHCRGEDDAHILEVHSGVCFLRIGDMGASNVRKFIMYSVNCI